ncbi:sphingomyelin phosphodiesterase [Heliocybe sulcata]|uniref:Sphingomyelin phosphodiesterase n=1 Tax=Heliocybe sulcata TaxID=5364 RepID=A0A5C3NSQ9_9AGAM|nr:sphingomyelin phosphodiesterase [Heliocybe sulcata]
MTLYKVTVVSAILTAALGASQNYVGIIQPSTYAPPGAFPTSLYSSYYNNPTATVSQVQPVISDPVTHEIYPFNLTDPGTIPYNDTADPHPLPPPATSSGLVSQALTQIASIATNPVFGDNTCARCQAGLEVAKFVVLAAPQIGPELAVAACEYFNYSSTCELDYMLNDLGGVITQLAAFADVGGYDGQAICSNFLGLCDMPFTTPLNLTGWFAKPKPNPLPPPRKATGERLKVLHISDAHIDPRYTTGAESNCSDYLCCRPNVSNDDSPDMITVPAPRYGAYYCDSPYALMTAALESMPVLAGTEESGFAWTIFTGDLVSHDPDYQLQRSYIMYTETVVYDLFKRLLGSGPVYPSLGNHDTHNEAQDALYSLPDGLGQQFSWNYDHVSSLWEYEGWIDQATGNYARTHYAAYMVRRVDGLRIITLNTDFWYRANYFNYINMTDPDPSGMLRFITDELQDAEDAGDRGDVDHWSCLAWLGWHECAVQPHGFVADLKDIILPVYQIIERYSPHVIANTFFGHSHEDELSIIYTNNGTNMSAATALTPSWVCPSITPLTNLNSGFRVYEVDSGTFDILDAHTYWADVNSFPDLDNQTEYGPAYRYEYNTREAYGGNITWGSSDPLNATWWHLVTEAMEADPSLVSTFNTYEGKSSVRTASCTGECAAAKICYIRSGSASLAAQNCPSGYGSVQ